MSDATQGEDRRLICVGEGARRVDALLAPALADQGYAIVRVVLGGEREKQLQIMIERLDGDDVDIDDCAKASRTVEALLDVEDPIAGRYVLEVSSPGIDRPLTRPVDFERFAGFEAKVELSVAYDDQRRFRGELLGFVNNEVRLLVDGQELGLPFAEVAKAKLVMTDALLAAQGRGQGSGRTLQ